MGCKLQSSVEVTGCQGTTEHLALAFLLASLLLGFGCARGFYREQADAEAYCLIDTKNGDPRWRIDDYSIATDPASRMFDPNSLDCPPMPPDDPKSHTLMHCVDGKRGSAHWHDDGDTPYVENPEWKSFLPTTENGSVHVDIDTVTRLALLHSPEYQGSLEQLYLSALDVSFERFRFDTQFFGGFGVFYTADGRARSTSGGESSSTLQVGTSAQRANWTSNRLFATGAELAVGFANSLVWQFSGPDTHTATTLLDFSLVQPLLRGAGRAVVLERLTISERALLANVRQMYRYRQSFYLQLITGQAAENGPSRRGGVLGGSGLEGFSGVGGGGFGRLGGFNNFGNGGNNAFQFGAGAGQAGGFLGLLQAQQNIRNQRSNIAALRSSVSQLEAFFLAGRIDYFQVELARQALYEGQSRLLNAEQDYQTTLDRYKATIGLPPSVHLIIDDRFIKPFQLIDTNLVAMQNQLTNIQEAVGKQLIAILEQTKSNGEKSALLNPALATPDAGTNANETSSESPQATEHLPQTNAVNNPDDADKTPAETESNEAGDAKSDVDSGTNQAAAPLWELGSLQSPQQESAIITLTAAMKDSRAASRHVMPAVMLVAELQQQENPSLEWSAPLAKSLTEIRELMVETTRMATDVGASGIETIRKDVESYRQSLSDRISNGERLQASVYPRLQSLLTSIAQDASTPAEPANAGSELFPYDADRLQKLPNQLIETLDELEKQFKSLEKSLAQVDADLKDLIENGSKQKPNELFAMTRDKVLLPIPNLLNELAANFLSLTLVQARARTEKVTLTPVDMTWENALEIARQNRLDWMNARASLVDTWRLIRFNANALRSQLDLVFSGDMGNVGDNPLRLRSTTGRLRVGARFDAPITRLSERNQYRQALIEYQQARRSFYQFEDRVAREIRQSLRSLDVNQLNFEFRRAAVDVAIAQVELARLRLQEPPRPEVEAQFGNTTARDLVSALTDLLNVQNDFLSVWVNHEALRRSLDLSLGTMQLDAAGIWMDPGPLSDDIMSPPSPGAIEELPSPNDTNKETSPETVSDESLPPPLVEELRQAIRKSHETSRGPTRLPPVPPSPSR
jgi:outer membrane protein TolC